MKERYHFSKDLGATPGGCACTHPLEEIKALFQPMTLKESFWKSILAPPLARGLLLGTVKWDTQIKGIKNGKRSKMNARPPWARVQALSHPTPLGSGASYISPDPLGSGAGSVSPEPMASDASSISPEP